MATPLKAHPDIVIAGYTFAGPFDSPDGFPDGRGVLALLERRGTGYEVKLVRATHSLRGSALTLLKASAEGLVPRGQSDMAYIDGEIGLSWTDCVAINVVIAGKSGKA